MVKFLFLLRRKIGS